MTKSKSLMGIAVLLFLSLQAKAQNPTEKYNATIINSSQGSVIELPGFFDNQFNTINYQKVILPGPQYLISDDPEYIRIPEAIALQEAVAPGTVRLYIYNVNGVEDPEKIDRKITAVIQNTGEEKMNIRMLKYSSQPPSANYFKVGKQGLADFFASNPEQNTRTVKPGKAIAIDQKLEKNIVRYNELVHGFYEFVIDQPGIISIIQTSPEKSGPEALSKIDTVLPPKSHSGAGRGIFGVSNYAVKTTGVYDTQNGAAEIIVADGKTDPWVVGYESTSGQQAELAGNYGVIYDIEMDWKSSDGKGLALVTWNSRSADNKWCGGMAASMVVSEGKFNSGIIQLPSNELITRGAPEAILIQVFPPAPDGEVQTIKLKYSPPGASCLPTPLVFVPVDMK